MVPSRLKKPPRNINTFVSYQLLNATHPRNTVLEVGSETQLTFWTWSLASRSKFSEAFSRR